MDGNGTIERVRVMAIMAMGTGIWSAEGWSKRQLIRIIVLFPCSDALGIMAIARVASVCLRRHA